MEVVLVLIYTALFSFLIYKTRCFENPFISKRFLIFFFWIKVVAAIAYGAIQWYYYGYGDTFFNFRISKIIASALPEYPLDYLKLTFGPAKGSVDPAILERLGVDKIPKYGVPRNYMFIRINSVLQLFSFGNYYVHSVFFAFFSFTGIYWLLQFMIPFMESKRNWLVYGLCFFPSILFWGSGVHKDAIILFGLGLILFSLGKLLAKKWQYTLLFILGVWLTYVSRNYAFLILLPALFAFVLTWLWPKHTLFKFGIIYLMGGLFFFLGKHIHPRFNFPNTFIEIQKVFLSHQGRSTFEMENLEPSFLSFIQLTPQGLFNIMLRPGWNELKSSLHVITLADNYLLVLLLLFTLFLSSYKLSKKQLSLFLFCVGFSVSFLVIIGLIVTNLGALVRYKMTATVFLIAACILIIDEEKVRSFLNRIGR